MYLYTCVDSGLCGCMRGKSIKSDYVPQVMQARVLPVQVCVRAGRECPHARVCMLASACVRAQVHLHVAMCACVWLHACISSRIYTFASMRMHMWGGWLTLCVCVCVRACLCVAA